jgi:hypothetical protein
MRSLSFSANAALWLRRIVLAVFFASTSAAQSNVLISWNEAFTQALPEADATRPSPVDLRSVALAHLAIAGALETAPPGLASDETKLGFVAIGAAQEATARLWPAQRAAAAALVDRQLASCTATADAARLLAQGREFARRLIDARAADGWRERSLELADPSLQGSERLIAELAAGAEAPPSPWLSAQPFVLKSVAQIGVQEVAAIGYDGSLHRNDVLSRSRLFRRLEHSGSPDVIDAAWSGASGSAWNRVARTLATRERLGLRDQARLFAMLNVALADARLSAAHWAHTVGSWRSRTVEVYVAPDAVPHRSSTFEIQAAVDGSDAAPVHRELRRVLIPPTPDYPAVSATLAGAAQAILEAALPSGAAFTLEFPRDGADPLSLRYVSVAAAAADCAFATTLKGRHTREAAVAGHLLGSNIGREVARRFRATSFASATVARN